MKRTLGLGLILCFVALFVIACGSTDDSSGSNSADPNTSSSSTNTENNTNTGSEPEEEDKEPYEMTVYAFGVSESEFDERFRGAIEEDFPHITFTYLPTDTGNSITDYMARGEIPDIFRIDIPNLKRYLDYGLLQDLTPLVEKHDFDLAHFNESFIKDIVDAGQTGELYGLPVPPYFPRVLYYNIDLFDRFGEDYPTDGMSWDEIYGLAQRLSRSEGDAVYHGFVASLTSILRDNQFSLPVMHPTEDGISDSDRWKQIFDNYVRFFEIPNNDMGDSLGSYAEPFNEGFAAMYSGQFNLYAPISEDLNWDIVSIPIIPEGPARMGQRGPAYWTVTAQSEHQDEAFQTILTMLSDEVQMTDSLNGILPTVSNPEVIEALGQGHPVYQTKNMGALSYYLPSDAPQRRDADAVLVADSAQTNLIRQKFHDVTKGLKDVNTALREVDEELKRLAEVERVNQGN